jgi:hypothetical protein
MLGGLGNITGLLKQAKEFQGKMQEVQEQLRARRYEAQAGGGMVRVAVNGRSELASIKIDPQAVDDLEVLEDLIIAAVNAAQANAQRDMQEEMSKLTGGLNIPGLSGLMGGAGR